MESTWEPEPMPGSQMGTAFLFILFSSSTSDNLASLWDEGPGMRTVYDC